jgi:hypothetical protein
MTDSERRAPNPSDLLIAEAGEEQPNSGFRPPPMASCQPVFCRPQSSQYAFQQQAFQIHPMAR